MLGFIVSLLMLIVATLSLVVQLAGGYAVLGVDSPIERNKRPGQFWFAIGLETLIWVVFLLSFAVFQLGIKL